MDDMANKTTGENLMLSSTGRVAQVTHHVVVYHVMATGRNLEYSVPFPRWLQPLLLYFACQYKGPNYNLELTLSLGHEYLYCSWLELSSARAHCVGLAVKGAEDRGFLLLEEEMKLDPAPDPAATHVILSYPSLADQPLYFIQFRLHIYFPEDCATSSVS
jgi:hypothetical protein